MAGRRKDLGPPETYVLALLVLKLEKLQGAVGLEGAFQVPGAAVHLGDHGSIGKALAVRKEGKRG